MSFSIEIYKAKLSSNCYSALEYLAEHWPNELKEEILSSTHTHLESRQSLLRALNNFLDHTTEDQDRYYKNLIAKKAVDSWTREERERIFIALSDYVDLSSAKTQYGF